MVFDPDGAGNRALKQPYPIDAADYGYDHWTARIGATPSTTGPRRASSPAETDRRDGICGSPRDPRSRSNSSPTARTRRASRRPRQRCAIRWRSSTGRWSSTTSGVVLDGWTGSVNHNWGTRHTPAYAFGQVCGFDDAPESTLEIVTARAAIGPVLLPAATLFVFRHAGAGVRGALDPGQPADARPAISRSRGRSAARVGDQMIEGEIVAEPADVIGLTLHRHRRRLQVLLQLGDRDVPNPGGGQGVSSAELMATRRAMFEILTDAPPRGGAAAGLAGALRQIPSASTRRSRWRR